MIIKLYKKISLAFFLSTSLMSSNLLANNMSPEEKMQSDAAYQAMLIKAAAAASGVQQNVSSSVSPQVNTSASQEISAPSLPVTQPASHSITEAPAVSAQASISSPAPASIVSPPAVSAPLPAPSGVVASSAQAPASESATPAVSKASESSSVAPVTPASSVVSKPASSAPQAPVLASTVLPAPVQSGVSSVEAQAQLSVASRESLAPSLAKPQITTDSAEQNQSVKFKRPSAEEVALKAVLSHLKNDFDYDDFDSIPKEIIPSVLREALRMQAKMDAYASDIAMQNVIEIMREADTRQQKHAHIKAIWKALDNPHFARQSILAIAIKMNKDAFIKKAASRLINDIAPGEVNDMQIHAVVSAAKAAMMSVRQNQSADDSSFNHKNPALSKNRTKLVTSHDEPEDENTDKVEISTKSCLVPQNFTSMMPQGCVLYTVNYYGSEGINNFHMININGQLQPLRNTSVHIKGPVKWSLTYNCSVNNTTAAPTDTSAVEQKPQTMVNLNCDGQGLKTDKNVLISRLINNNGVMEINQ